MPTCGLPPCDLYVSRSRTRSLDSTLSDHSIATEVAVHLLVGAVCGGFLCVLGEGYTVNRVEDAAHQAAQNNECLRIHALPQGGHGLDLVEFDASNQSPYCTN